MTDMTMILVMTFCVAMTLVGLALTAQEFRRMSNPRSRRDRLGSQTAREMRPAPVQTWRTR
jgi:hypothetical protein